MQDGVHAALWSCGGMDPTASARLPDLILLDWNLPRLKRPNVLNAHQSR